jgi:hypothetical protein
MAIWMYALKTMQHSMFRCRATSRTASCPSALACLPVSCWQSNGLHFIMASNRRHQ